MANNSGIPTIVAALIIAAALIASSQMIKSSLDATVAGLDGVREAVQGAAAARPAAAQRPTAARPGRPDPNRVYNVDIKGSPTLGPNSAKITVVEFSDFQCPFCRRVWPTLQRIREEYGDDVRIAFKHLPLSIHPKAKGAHEAAEAAHLQGKFWEMHDKLLETKDFSPAGYAKLAAEIGLDTDRFSKDVASSAVKKKVEDDSRDATKLGVTGTPGFFINGRFLSGAQPFEAFKRSIDRELEQG